nr:MAG TPA: hypothetical protein [Caudoviricetes sp.]
MKEVYFYEFCSDRQYIFCVEVGGVRRLIEFGDQNQFGRSVYQTKNRQIAEAIRKTSMFKRGRIVETSAPKQEDDVRAPSPQQNKIEVKTFANITQAKEWVSKFCGIDKSKLRRPAQTIEAAAEHGIKIEITKE